VAQPALHPASAKDDSVFFWLDKDVILGIESTQAQVLTPFAMDAGQM
jgi:hypothetical protein